MKKKAAIAVLSIIIFCLTGYLLSFPAIAIDRNNANQTSGFYLEENSETASNETGIVLDNQDDETVTEKTEFEYVEKESAILKVEKTIKGEPEENSEENEAQADLIYPAQTFNETVNDSIVYVETPEGAFPEGTVMVVKEIEVDDDLIETIENQLDNKKVTSIKALDIGFIYNNEEFDPLVPIKVSISSAFIEENEGDPSVVHVKEEKEPEVIEATVSEEEVIASISDENKEAIEEKTNDINEVSTDNTISFDAESFSVYAIVYTVDFHYEINGQSFEQSIAGGTYISLRDLLSALKVEDVDGFINDIKELSFTDPELISIKKVDEETTVGSIIEENGLSIEYSSELTEEDIERINNAIVKPVDYVLISLKPFDTKEALTVTMKNEDSFEIKVTDSSYTGSDETDQVLNGRTGALVNIYNNNAMQSSCHLVSGRLGAAGIVYDQSTNTISTVNPGDRITEWTFIKVGEPSYYNIRSSAGYLNMNTNDNSGLTVGATPQTFVIERNTTNGTIRIRHHDSNNAVNNFENNTNSGYGVWGSGDTNNRGEQFKLIELSNAREMIVLSPMNEDGILPEHNLGDRVTSTHYKKMIIDGYLIDDNDDANLNRARIYVPVQYNNNGTATITLPSNSQLSSFKVSDTEPEGTKHSIVQSSDKYQWILHGWYDIATKKYYDTTNGPATVTINQGELNVFYADWWAANYNYTVPEGQLTDTEDTSDFVTIKMWDYNEIFNLRNSTAYKPDGDSGRFIPRDSVQSEEWYIDGSSKFQFVDNTDGSNCWQYGTLGNTQWRNRYEINWSVYDGTGILGILGSQGASPSTGVLESLFPETVTPGSGVNYLGQGNYLFKYDETTKKYSYDSDVNGAVYNQSAQRFYVSSSPRNNHWRGGGGGYREDVGFFPLNDGDKTKRIEYNNGTTNNWFGMSINLDFWLPDIPGSSDNANLIGDQHMRFDFKGDDDVWVLIDGKLALDIGGIHEAVGGYIDFSTGEIKNAKGNTYRLSDMGVGAGDHTLSFYYLERGGNASNCKITFTIVPRWMQDSPEVNTAKVTKTWSEGTPDSLKTNLAFTLKTKDGTTINTVNYSDGTVDNNGKWSYVWEGLDANNDYVVSETEDIHFVVNSTSNITGSYDYWAEAAYNSKTAFGTETIFAGKQRKRKY